MEVYDAARDDMAVVEVTEDSRGGRIQRPNGDKI